MAVACWFFSLPLTLRLVSCFTFYSLHCTFFAPRLLMRIEHILVRKIDVFRLPFFVFHFFVVIIAVVVVVVFSINISIGRILLFVAIEPKHAWFTCNAPLQLELVIIYLDSTERTNIVQLRFYFLYIFLIFFSIAFHSIASSCCCAARRSPRL